MRATCVLVVLFGGLVLATPAGAAGVKPEESEEEVVKKAAEAAADSQYQPSLDEETVAEEARVAREERGQAAEQARIEREGPDRTYRPLPTNRMFRASEKRRREQARAEAEAAASADRGDEARGPVEGEVAAASAVVTASAGRPRPSGWLVFAGVALAAGLVAAVALNELK
jgi:hypothetical protein